MSTTEPGQNKPSDRACGPNGSDLVLAEEGNDNAVQKRSQGEVVSSAPAARLRLAADLLEQRAAAATPGPWRYANPDEIDDLCAGPARMDQPGAFGLNGEWVAECGPDADDDALWIAMLGPQVAAPLAAWLRAEAVVGDTWESDASGESGNPLPTGPLAVAEALALVDAILGGEGR